MSALLMKDRRRSDVRDSDAYNQLQAPETIVARGHAAQAAIGSRKELLRVLVVDDYRASADTMSRLVATWGHVARRAYDGTTGLALAVAYQPDVLLLDLIMSGVGGLALARQVRRQARVNNCLMIAITGRTDAEHRLQCEEAGIDLFLIKPVDLSFLQTLLAVASECRLQTQRDTEAYDAIAESLRQRHQPDSLRRPRLPWHVFQEYRSLIDKLDVSSTVVGAYNRSGMELRGTKRRTNRCKGDPARSDSAVMNQHHDSRGVIRSGVGFRTERHSDQIEN